MTNTLKPSTIAGSGIVCVRAHVCVCEQTQASICLKNHKIFIYIMGIFLQYHSFKRKNSLWIIRN